MDIIFWLFQEIINGFNWTKNTVFLLISIDSEIRLSWYQKTIFLNNGPNTITNIITRLLHEIRRGWGHKHFNTTIWVLFNFLISFIFLIFLQFLNGLIKQFYRQTKRKYFSILFQNLKKSNFFLSNFSLLINSNVRLSQNRKSWIYLLLWCTWFSTK